MPLTIEGLQKVNDLTSSIIDSLQRQAMNDEKEQQGSYEVAQTQDKYNAAKIAAQKYQAGDITGAYSAMGAADPEFLQKALGNSEKAQKDASYGKTYGEEKAKSEFGDLGVDQAKAKGGAEKPTYQTLPQDGLKHKIANGVDMGVIGGNSPDELNNVDKKMLKPYIDNFKKTADKYDEAINGSEDFQSLVNGNLPGSKLPAVMKFLVSQEGVKRFNEREFSEMGKPGDLMEQAKQAVQQRQNGQPWTPAQQQFMNQVAKTLQFSTLNAYMDKIQSESEGAKQAVGKNPEKVEAAIAANAHPMAAKVYQHIQDQVKQDPKPEQAKQAIDWARHNFTDPRAKQILIGYGLWE